MSTKQIATSTLWQVASQITMAALSIVTVKFVALGLTKELAGEYNTAYGFLQIFGILADFGLYAVAVREVSKAHEKDRADVFGVIILLRIITLIFSLAVALLFVWILPTWHGTVLPLGVLFGGIGAALLFVFSFLFGRTLLPIRPHWDTKLVKHIALQALPYGLAFLCTALYRQSDVTIIGILRSDYAVQNAYYGFVQRAMDMAYLFPTFLLNSCEPSRPRWSESRTCRASTHQSNLLTRST